VKRGPWDDWIPGVLSKKQVKVLAKRRYIRNASTDDRDFDYSSFDLRIAPEAYKLKACVKAFGRDFAGRLLDLKLSEPLYRERDDTYLLERRKSYLFRVMEQIPELRDTPIYGSATAKSSVGRMDVLARLIVDGMDTYEGFEPNRIAGGDMYLEVTPMTFNVRVKPGTALTQLRLYKGPQKESLVQGETLPATVFDGCAPDVREASLSVDLTPDRVSGCEVSAFSASLQKRGEDAVIDLWKKKHENQKAEPWKYWKFEITDANRRLRIVKDRFYIIRSREKIHLPPGIAVYCRASDETIGEMRIHYAGFVHPFFGFDRGDGTRGTPLIFEVRGHDIDVSLMDGEKMARLEFYRMSEDSRKERSGKKGPYESQSLKLSSFFRSWPKKVRRAKDGTVTPA
jgi:dCTP deaminase